MYRVHRTIQLTRHYNQYRSRKIYWGESMDSAIIIVGGFFTISCLQIYRIYVCCAYIEINPEQHIVVDRNIINFQHVWFDHHA